MNFYNNGAVIRTQLEKAAKCSLPLIKALSDERIYKVLILFTFFDNDERHPVDESYFKPASYEYLTRSQRICLQMDILECPWCAYAPLKTYRRYYVSRHHKGMEITRSNAADQAQH
jgi:hypothetical protein